MENTMPKRIDSLTAAQTEQMAAHRDRWIKTGLTTGPADRERFERAVLECYRFSGLEPPKRIVWITSPLAMAFAGPTAALVLELRKRLGAVRGAVDGAVRGAVDGAVYGAVRGAVDGAVGGAVYGAVDGAVDGAVRGAVDGAVYGAVGGAVGGAVDRAVGGAVRGAVDRAVAPIDSRTPPIVAAIAKAVLSVTQQGWYRFMGGQLWAAWPAWESFFREVCGLELQGDLSERGRVYAETVQSACWWWPHREFVIVCERPTSIKLDGRGRLHCSDGPAIVWPDGWGVYSWHGVALRPEVVEQRDRMTVAQIDGEPNVEVRRAMLEIFGEERYILKSKVVCIQKDRYGELYRKAVPDDEPVAMVRVVNSTPEPDGVSKIYFLRVPPDTKTAREGVAWTFGREAKHYAPQKET
jgi:hypothetical protein